MVCFYCRLFVSLVICCLFLLSSVVCFSCHLWFVSLVICGLFNLSSVVYLTCHL